MADILQINWRYDKIGQEESKRPNFATGGRDFSLRTAKKRSAAVCDEKPSRARKRGPKPRVHTAKMSKYRRKTANARERMRMGEINTAFDKLKDKIPLPVGGNQSSAQNGRMKIEKLTKINILHIAINYIHALEDILDTGQTDANIYPERLIKNPFLPQAQEKVKEAGKLDERASGGGSSPDSGIQEDEEEEDFPEWTELRSTLYLHPPATSAPNPQDRANENPQHRAYTNPPTLAANSHDFHQPPSAFVLEPKRPRKIIGAEKPRERNRKPVTLTTRNFSDLNDLGHFRDGFHENSHLIEVMSMLPTENEMVINEYHPSKEACKEKMIDGLNLPLPTDDLEEGGMSDFLCDFENFESIPEIEFSYDDPFKII